MRLNLLDGASAEFDHGTGMQKGELSPVFFGSALTNFGVETFPEAFPEDDHTHRFRENQITGVVDPM